MSYVESSTNNPVFVEILSESSLMVWRNELKEIYDSIENDDNLKIVSDRLFLVLLDMYGMLPESIGNPFSRNAMICSVCGGHLMLVTMTDFDGVPTLVGRYCQNMCLSDSDNGEE